MTKSTKTTKTSAIFLATVLVAGIIALSSPSFMIGAQAESDYYGMDKDNYKSKYSSYEHDYYKPKFPSHKPDYFKSKDNVIVKKIKCNNVNINVNDLSVKVGTPRSGDTSAQVTGGSTGGQGVAANSFGNSETNNFEHFDKDFVFVCINNNDNGGKDVDREKTCKGCLLQALGFQGLRDFIQYLSTLPPTAANDLQEYCDLIQSEIERGDTRAQVQAAIQADLTGAGITLDATELADLVDCLFEVFGDETNTR